MKTAKWNHPEVSGRTSVLDEAVEKEALGMASAQVTIGAFGGGQQFGLNCWCLPSGQGLTEFALQAGFLAPQSMLPRWWQSTKEDRPRQEWRARHGVRHAGRTAARECR
jgi:hypothetical protein